MSTSEKATKLDEKKSSVDFIKNEILSAKLGTIASETCIRPRFANHTLSSLMKTRTPMDPRKKSSSKSAKASKRSQIVVSSKLNRIYKRRSITKQSKSMQVLKTILKREKKDLRASSSRQDRPFESTTAIYEYTENSLVFLPKELIKDISRDLKKCAASPAKSVVFRDEPAKVEQLNDEKKEVTNSENREVEVLHRGSREPGEENLAERFSNEDYTAIEVQIHRQNVNDATTNRQYAFRRGNRKTWNIRKSETRHVDNSQDKDDRSVVNCAVPIRKRGAFQKNLVFTNQRVWKPPGVARSSIIKSTMSLMQPMSQKSSRSTERAIASTENKFSSIEHVEILNNEPMNASISVNQSKVLMKENRDPRVNRVTKICEHLVETKQRQRLQSGGAIPKRRRSTTKVGSKTSNKRNDAKPTRSRSRSKSNSRHRRTVTSRESSQSWNEQYRNESAVIYRRRSRPSEIIHALKEINGVREDEDVEENAMNVIDCRKSNDVFNNKEDDSGLQANCDAGMLQNDEVNFTKNKNFDEPNQPFDQSFCKSISTQTEESLDSKEVLKLTLTQSSPNSSNVEIGCNTMHYSAICKNAEVSCDLINSTNSKADIDSTIEDKTPTLEDVPVHTESIKPAESSTEDEYSDKSKKLLVNECKQTLSTETLILEDYDTMETLSNTTNDFIRLEEKIMNENSQTFSKLSTNSDDKTNIDIDTHQESTKYSRDNSFSEKSHRPSSSTIYDYDASCSSEELAEYLENNVQYGNIVMSELEENIPGDVIAALELAAERARNLHKAIIIYYENLRPRETEKRDEETEAEDYETVEGCACFSSCEIKHRKKSENDEKYYPLIDMTNSEDVERFSTCSSKSSNSVRMCEEKISLADYRELLNQEEESAALPCEKALAKSSARDLAEVKSLVQLLMHRSREEYALELLQSEEDEYDGEDFEAAGAIKTLALPMTSETSISRENLLPFIYCILFSVVFWYLQFSSQCESPAT